MSKPQRVLTVHDFSLLLIRVMVGVVFIAHGSQKLFGWWGGPGMDGETGFIQTIAGLQLHIPFVDEPMAIPGPAAWLAAITEFAGGILLVAGFIARVAALLLAGTMAVAIMTVHYHSFFLSEGGMEFALTLGVICFALMMSGAGRLTLFGILTLRAFKRDEEVAQKRHDKAKRKKMMMGDDMDDDGPTRISSGPLAAAPPSSGRAISGSSGPSDAARQTPPPMRPDMRSRPSDDDL